MTDIIIEDYSPTPPPQYPPPRLLPTTPPPQPLKYGTIPLPQMVFSIIGDSVDYVPTPWRKRVFQTALFGAASNVENSWIIIREKEGPGVAKNVSGEKEDVAKNVSGETEGVAKIVSGAYEDYFCREYFDHKGKFRYELKDEKPEKMDKLSIHLIRLKKGVGPKRMTFISESSGDYYHEFKLKDLPVDIIGLPAEIYKENKVTAFECAISKKQVSYFEEGDLYIKQSMPVPVIVIVVGGDVESIKHAKSAVQENIPILLVKGSGKAADLILKYMQDVEFVTEIFECVEETVDPSK